MQGLELTERGKVASTVKNMREIFRQDTSLCEIIDYDTFSNSHVRELPLNDKIKHSEKS